ncbi:MAG: IclR family transcriptional regulator [Actinocatenispora sp.]
MSESLRRSLRVIDALADEPATATQVAAMTGVSLSTAVRLLQVLHQEGFARRDSAGRYGTGTRLLSIAHRAVAAMDVRQAAAPVLRRLNRDTGQTVHLGYFDSPTVVYLDKYDGTAPVQMYSRIGLAAPLHCTAMGKVLAAHLPEEERAHLAGTLDYPRFTDRTVGSAEEYLRELAEIRERGYALNLGEHETVISAVAVALVRPDGRVEHGVDLAVPNVVVTDDDLLALVPRVVQAAREIEALLGYR